MPRSLKSYKIQKEAAKGGGATLVSDTQPEKADEGTLWYNKDTEVSYIAVKDTVTGTIDWKETSSGSSGSGGGGTSLTVSETAPTGAIVGELWFDSQNANLYTYYDNNWIQTNSVPTSAGASIAVSSDPPVSPTNGQVWWDSDTANLYVAYNDGTSTQWIQSSSSPVTPVTDDANGGGSVTTYATISELPLSGNTAGDQAYVSDVNRLYLWTGAGWYNIALINETPTAITGVSTSYSLATDGTATVITAVSSDPEEIPLTWSYAVTTGSIGTTATISQADNVFTITPSTTESDAGEFGITISVTDGINTATTTSNIRLAFVEPPTYQFQVYGVTGSTTSDSYQINGVDTSYTGGSTISTTALSLDVSRTIQHQYLQSNSGVSLGAVDMTSATSDDFTWQFFINTSQAGSYHNVFNDGGVFNTHTFKYGDNNAWYWYDGTSLNPPAGTNHQGANTWYHMIIQGEYSTGTIYSWIDTTYIGSNVVGQAFWDTYDLADFANMTINTTGSESHNMYIGEMKIWKGYQFYTPGQNITWAEVFG